MRYLTLEAATDEYDSSLGFRVQGTPQVDGMSVDRGDIILAHDICEHQNGVRNIGPIWDELEALGAIWQVRGRWGDMLQESRHSPQVNIASDLTRMGRDLAFMDSPWDYDGLACHAPDTRPIDDDETLLEIIEISRGDIRAELDGQALDFDLYYKEALARMRIGFRKSAHRWGNRFRGINTMRAINDAVRDAVRCIDYEGQQFRLGYGNGNARIYEIPDPYAYD